MTAPLDALPGWNASGFLARAGVRTGWFAFGVAATLSFLGVVTLLAEAGSGPAPVEVEALAPPDDAGPYRALVRDELWNGEQSLLRVDAAWSAAEEGRIPRSMAANVTREEEAALRDAQARLDALEPPPGYVVSHGEIVAGFGDLADALALVAECHETENVETCGRASVALDDAVERIRAAVARWP